MVSIQKVAATSGALALPPGGLELARNAVLAVPPPPWMGLSVVEIFSAVLLFMCVPCSELWSAFCRTLFGFLTISWVTPGDLNRKLVGIDRSSSLKLWATELKSPFAGAGLPKPNGRMLLSGMCCG